MTISESEIIEALAASVRGDSEGDSEADAMTVSEMALRFGRCRALVERALRQFMAEGRLRRFRVPREMISGAVKLVPAYSILPAKPAKAAKPAKPAKPKVTKVAKVAKRKR